MSIKKQPTTKPAAAPKGKRLTKGRWVMTPKKGTKRQFTGSLIGTVNSGKQRIALFSVPKSFS